MIETAYYPGGVICNTFFYAVSNTQSLQKCLMVVYEKVYFFSLTRIMSTTKRKISMRNKEYTNNKLKYQREERIQIRSAKEMGHRVVGGVAVGAAGVIGLAYGVAV